jgi:hypothetical protein
LEWIVRGIATAGPQGLVATEKRSTMGDKGKGKDRGNAIKAAKPARGGLRPHERRQQAGALNTPRP